MALHSKPRSSPGCSAMTTSPEEEMPPRRPCAVDLGPRQGRGEENTLCCPMVSPQEIGTNLQLGSRMKQPNSSEPLGIGIGMRKGVDLKMKAVSPPTMESHHNQGQSQLMLAAGVTVVNFPTPEFPHSGTQPTPEFPHSGTQPVPDTCGSMLDPGSYEDCALAANGRIQSESDPSSDLIDLNVDLKMEKLVSESVSDTDSNDVVDKGRRPAVENGPLPLLTQPCAIEEVKGGSYQGLMYGNNEQLQGFVKNLKFKQHYSGINVWKGLRVPVVKGLLRYEMGEQFKMLKELQPARRSSQGVFLCQDKESKKKFVLKKIFITDFIMRGLEFLIEHSESFLPKIYAVYKEINLVWIFEEYVECELYLCDWGPSQVWQFARRLLWACDFLHECKLAHCDFKPANIMVRDRDIPESLVLIDFETALHIDDPLISEGHTPTFLPPWHRKLRKDIVSPLLMMADMWAVAGVFICLLTGSSWNQQQRKHLRELGVNSRAQQHQQQSKGCCRTTIWAPKVTELKKECRRLSQSSKEHGSQLCKVCKEWFFQFLETHGHEILSAHLGPMMVQRIDDSKWESLLKLLKYLTDCNDPAINAATALELLEW